MTNPSNMPIEATEMEFAKILARKYELKADTGGAGEMRGGLDIERELEVLQDNVLYTGLGDRHKFHPLGTGRGPAAMETRRSGRWKRCSVMSWKRRFL